MEVDDLKMELELMLMNGEVKVDPVRVAQRLCPAPLTRAKILPARALEALWGNGRLTPPGLRSGETAAPTTPDCPLNQTAKDPHLQELQRPSGIHFLRFHFSQPTSVMS